MKKRETWDVKKFDEVNLPEVVFEVDNKEEFSSQEKGRVRVLDLPIMMPAQGIRIPNDIPKVFADIAKKVLEKENEVFGDIDEMYAYITIDQKTVEKGKTGRRAGAHSDAYIERDNRQIDITEDSYDVVSKEVGYATNTYIVSDCLPTEFFIAKFPLRDVSCDESLKTFDEIAENSEVITYPSYNVLKLTPYVVHRAAMCHKRTIRTFMKVSISNKKYAREGNTINPLFDYNWTMEPRDDKRNHPWSSQ